MSNHTKETGWVGIDLDGTLARYNGWRGIDHIGEPVRDIVEYAKDLLKAGVEVRIFTARVQEGAPAIWAVDRWVRNVFGRSLPITSEKDFGMVFCIDDRAVSVERNTGKFLVDPPSIADIAWHFSPKNPDNPEAAECVSH